MEFGLSELQTELQESVNRYLREQVNLGRVRQFAESDHTLATDIWSGLTDLGVVGALVPEQFGGVGLSAMDVAVISESLGYHVTPVPYLSSSVVAPRALALAGSDNQKNELLPKIAQGELTVGLAFSESCAQRGQAGVIAANGKLNGTAQYVLEPNADLLLFADRDGGLHMVENGEKGLISKKMPHVDRTRPLGSLVLENTSCDTLPGSSPAVLSDLLDLAWVAIAYDTLGAAQSMLDQAIAYAMQREQFNRVIASFQAVKHMCAEMAAEIEPSRSLLWYAGYALDDAPEEAHLLACHAKAHMSEVGTFVGRTATIVHGGMGFTDLLGLHYWFKRIGFNRQILGGPEWLREQAAISQNLAA